MAEASATSPDGSVIDGFQFDGQEPPGAGWRKRVGSPTLEYFGPINGTSSTTTLAMSKDGSMMVGSAGNPWFDRAAGPFLWSKQVGTVDLNEFLERQGASLETVANNLWTPMTMSDDASVIGGWAFGNLAWFGWIVQMRKAFVCHIAPENSKAAQTISVSFPATFDEHLAHGDTPGPCQNYEQQ